MMSLRLNGVLTVIFCLLMLTSVMIIFKRKDFHLYIHTTATPLFAIKWYPVDYT